MTRTIDAVLFDLGGVFTESPFAVAEQVGRRLGARPGRLMEIVFGPYHADTDHPWHRLERGELSLAAAREEIIALGAGEGLDSDPYHVLALLAPNGGPRPEMVECVRRVRIRGCRTALVTNNAREFREAWLAMLPFGELFDAIVDSSEIGMRKPNPEIYRHALRQLGNVAPRRAAFLDDFEGNVAAAVRLGLQGILVDADPSAAIAKLDALLGEEPI